MQTLTSLVCSAHPPHRTALHRSGPWSRLLSLAGLVLLLGPGLPAAAQEHAEAPPHEDADTAGHDGHAAPQTHAGAHGGHQGRIENWFSLSFGPDKKHKNGPFAFAILNFIILLYLVVRMGKKPFTQYLSNRHTSIRDNLADAQRMRQEARQELDEIKGKLNNLEREIAEIKQGVKKDAELEKERIIADAHSQADALVRAADRTLEDELRRARRMLEAEAVSAAMEAAEKLIRQKIDDDDRKRINEEYYQEIASSGGTN